MVSTYIKEKTASSTKDAGKTEFLHAENRALPLTLYKNQEEQ